MPRVGELVETYGDQVAVHLVHFGGGMSGHIKLVGQRFVDWIEAGKRVYMDLSWAIGHDRVLFANDQSWGDRAGEYARLRATVGDGELGDLASGRLRKALQVTL
ncbi:hypothetical protein [Amycolatopsis sp.]|jgi:hypothetical protein|uniref:hypothetical protein n=1 Tax=Amycolatopsis sp. TaxID=37632 RepID=UPI002E00FCDE|nr:hypothetical protein [Amycolatopsis sp.]